MALRRAVQRLWSLGYWWRPISNSMQKHAKSAPVYLAAMAKAPLARVSCLRPWQWEPVVVPLRYWARICGPEILQLTHPPGSGFGISSWDGADEIPGNSVLIGLRPRGPFQRAEMVGGSVHKALVLRGELAPLESPHPTPLPVGNSKREERGPSHPEPGLSRKRRRGESAWRGWSLEFSS